MANILIGLATRLPECISDSLVFWGNYSPVVNFLIAIFPEDETYLMR